jgi:regulatory protein
MYDMTITALTPHARRRSRLDVFVDGVLAGQISRHTAKKRALRPGLQIAPEQLAALLAEDQRHLALQAAVAMIARRPHSERQVRQALRRRRFDDNAVTASIEQLRDGRLLDDADYARHYTDSRDRTSPRSQRLLRQELLAAGVTRDVATEAVARISNEDAAYRVAQGRRRALALLDEQTYRTRLGLYLQRRGFSWDVARSTVDRCWRDREGAQDTA